MRLGFGKSFFMLLVFGFAASAGASTDTEDNEPLCNTHSCTQLGSAIIKDNAPGLIYQQTVYFVNNITIDPLFIDNGDGTITDTTTGLMWEKLTHSIGNTWDEANAYCDSLALAGKNDWRLPNGYELQTLINKGNWAPAINTGFFPDTFPGGYWTSTAYTLKPSYAWFVYFGEEGGVGRGDKSTGHYAVRAVRAGQASTHCPARKMLGEDTIEQLHNFRDYTLAQTDIGRRIIHIYYANADRLSAALDRSPALRAFAKQTLEAVAPILRISMSP